jgi:hypothetical protein
MKALIFHNVELVASRLQRSIRGGQMKQWGTYGLVFCMISKIIPREKNAEQ